MKTAWFTRWMAVLIVMVMGRVDGLVAQEGGAEREIEKAIGDYLSAMSGRDAKGVQAVLAGTFVAVEAGDKEAKVHLVDPANTRELLPPEGNNDWAKERIRLGSIKATVSETHPSVAMAAFTLTIPLSDPQVTQFESILKDAPAKLDERQKEAMARIVANRAMHHAMFAMLAREQDRWKILSMTFPK